MASQVLFVFGLGYVGQHLGRDLIAKGWRVGGTTRTVVHCERLKSQGFEAMVWDETIPFPPQALEGVTHILVTIPPDEKGDLVLRHLDFANISPKWIGYLSATSVYGNHQGAWVTEKSSLKPTSARGRQRQLAETQWLEKITQDPTFPIHLFRLSGIYGPGRSVLDTIRSGAAQRLDKPGHVFSRIHIDDIVSVLKASMLAPQPGEIYNLGDDEPASTSDVIAYGCDLLGVDAPPLVPFEQGKISEALREFYADNKRVANDKIKGALKVSLAYPTYREGLKHC